MSPNMERERAAMIPDRFRRDGKVANETANMIGEIGKECLS